MEENYKVDIWAINVGDKIVLSDERIFEVIEIHEPLYDPFTLKKTRVICIDWFGEPRSVNKNDIVEIIKN